MSSTDNLKGIKSSSENLAQTDGQIETEMRRDELLLLIQDLLWTTERLAAERETYHRLISTQARLKQEADEFFRSPEYAAELRRYSELRNRVIDTLRQNKHVEFEQSLAQYVNQLGPIHIALKNMENAP